MTTLSYGDQRARYATAHLDPHAADLHEALVDELPIDVRHRFGLRGREQVDIEVQPWLNSWPGERRCAHRRRTDDPADLELTQKTEVAIERFR